MNRDCTFNDVPAIFPPSGWIFSWESPSVRPAVTAAGSVGRAWRENRLVLLSDSGCLRRQECNDRAAAVLQKWCSGIPAEQLWQEITGSGSLLLWDGEKQMLYAGVDQLGGGKVFVRHSGTTLTIANTMAVPAWRQRSGLTAQAVHDYLTLQYVPDGAFFQGTTALKGGQYLVLTPGLQQPGVQSWSEISLEPDGKLKEETAANQLREGVTAAVRRQLERANGHAAVLLSGGIDSAIVTGVAATLSRGPLRVYTAGFGEAAYDERDRAAAAAEAIRRTTGCKLLHEMREITPDDWDLFREIVRGYGAPYGDASLLATARLVRWAAGNGEELLLSGDGADELFGGYERYRFMQLTRTIPPLPGGRLAAALVPGGGERSFAGRLKRLLPALECSGLPRYFQLLDRFPEKLKMELYGEWMLAQSSTLLPTARLAGKTINADEGIAPYQQWDIRYYMPGDVLVKSALAGAHSGTPVISPFLDRTVVKFALHLPESLKIRGNCRKYLLSRAFPELVPPGLARRRKTGFGVPVSAWLRGPWKTRLEEFLLEGPLIAQNVIRRAPVERMVAEHLAGKRDRGYELWSLLTLALAWPEE